MKFIPELYKDRNYIMHCKTEEEAENFGKIVYKKLGKPWGKEYKNIWKKSQEKSIFFFFNANCCAYTTFIPQQPNNYIILKWEDFMPKKFTKSDLKPGDILVTKDEGNYMYIGEYMVCSDGWTRMGDYDDNLKLRYRGLHESDKFDIIKVLRPKDSEILERNWEYANLVWERPEEEIEEMTLEEICEALGKEIKIVKSK